MMGTFDCVYETPCHWCSKWDKKCDKKSEKEIFINECDHDWLTLYNPKTTLKVSTFCKKCGKIKDGE